MRDGYVESDSLSFTVIHEPGGRPVQVRLDGVIHGAGGVAVEVTKFMDVRVDGPRIDVITTYYRYHAWRPGAPGESIVRYDQAHGVPHCHRFRRDGKVAEVVTLTLDAMPRLDEVVREAVDTARTWDTDPVEATDTGAG